MSVLENAGIKNASTENAGRPTGKCRYWKMTVLEDAGVKYNMFANCVFPFNIFNLIHFRPLKVAMELIHVCGVFVQLHSY